MGHCDPAVGSMDKALLIYAVSLDAILLTWYVTVFSINDNLLSFIASSACRKH